MVNQGLYLTGRGAHPCDLSLEQKRNSTSDGKSSECTRAQRFLLKNLANEFDFLGGLSLMLPF